ASSARAQDPEVGLQLAADDHRATVRRELGRACEVDGAGVCVCQVEPWGRSGSASWSDHRNRVRTRWKLREDARAPARVDCDDGSVGGPWVRPKKRPSRHGAEAAWGDRDFVTSARSSVVADQPDVAICADRLDGTAGRFGMPGAAGGGHEPVAETA